MSTVVRRVPPTSKLASRSPRRTESVVAAGEHPGELLQRPGRHQHVLALARTVVPGRSRMASR